MNGGMHWPCSPQPPTDHYCVFHQVITIVQSQPTIVYSHNLTGHDLTYFPAVEQMHTFPDEMSFLVSKPTFVSIITLRSIFGGDQLTDRRPCYLAFTSSMQRITFTL